MRQKDIPKDLWVKEELWSVKFVRKLKMGKIECRGLTDPSTRTIYILQGQSYIERADTFFHELIHAFEIEYGINLKHSHVYLLGEAFAKILVDNF